MFLLSRFIGNPNAKMPGAGYSGRAGDMYSYSTLYYKVSNIGAAKGIECTAAIQFARQYHIRQHMLKTLLRMVVIAFLSFLTVFPSKRDTPSRSWIPIQQPKRGCFRANWFPTEDPLVPLLPNPIPLSVGGVNGMIME